jgi:aminocarboxymuconate-semialdehyde decarboxylase
MRIDAYTHFFPKKFFDMLGEAAADYPDMGKRVRSLPALYDLDVRKRIVEGHKDYQQILAYPQPPIEKFAKTGADIDAFCRVINDGFAELVAKEKDHFPGWVAHVSLAAPDAGVAEAERAIKKLGALGVQIYTNVAGKPLDRPEYLPFWNKMNELGAPVWLHPARGAETPDYISEDRSLYEMWWTFGWSYETACAMARLVFAKIIDTHPNLKIITHHSAASCRCSRAGSGPATTCSARAPRTLTTCRCAEPEKTRARLFQAGFLDRYRGVHRRAGDPRRHGVLPA